MWLWAVRRVNKVVAASGAELREGEHVGKFQGWLGKQKPGGLKQPFQRRFFVLDKSTTASTATGVVDEDGPPPPPPRDDGDAQGVPTDAKEATAPGDEGATAPPAAPTRRTSLTTGELKRSLIYFTDEACTDRKGVISLSDISQIVLQEYGSEAIPNAPPFDVWFELKSLTRTWVLAADSPESRSRWIAELVREGGLHLNDMRPSQQHWDHEGWLQTRKAQASLGWRTT